MQKIAILTRACRQTVAGLLFIFVVNGAGIRSATYLYLDSTKNVDKDWDINVLFIIHVNFDHVWVEHYPVTLSLCLPHFLPLSSIVDTALPRTLLYSLLGMDHIRNPCISILSMS